MTSGAESVRHYKTVGENRASIEEAIFGVLFTISKEKRGEKKVFVALKFIVEFVQLLLFTLCGNNVGQWGWRIDWEGSVFWRWLSYIQWENPITNHPTGSYTLWLTFFYILASMLCLSMALCAFVASCFRSGVFPAVWPVKLLRFIVSVIFSVLFVASLDVFLVGVACVPHPVTHKDCVLHNFPDVSLWPSSSHAVHAAISAIMSLSIVVISALTAASDSDQNFLSTDTFAAFDSLFDMRRFAICTALTLVSNFAISQLRLLSVLLLILFCAMLHDVLRFPPYYSQMANLCTGVATSLLAWSSLILVVKMFTGGPLPPAQLYPNLFPDADASGADTSDNSLLLTRIGFAVAPAAAVAGTLAVKFRLWRSKQRFERVMETVAELEDGDTGAVLASTVAEELPWLRFSSVAEVEMTIRHMRQVKPPPSEERAAAALAAAEPGAPALHPQAVLAAEAVLLIGMHQFSHKSALIHIMYGSFLISVRRRIERGKTYLERARAMRNSLRERFMIFVQDRNVAHRAQGDSVGSEAMDLVAFVEFQSSFLQTLSAHRAALRANRSFWRLLGTPRISFYALSLAFKQMDKTETLADASYRSVLARYPQSVKLLKAFASFLEEVRSNPWEARKFRERAEKVEQAVVDTNLDAEGGLQRVNDMTDGVVCCNASGAITVVNELLLRMFGYRNQEAVVGKSITILMPPPHDKLHDGYMQRYLVSGESSILGVRQRLEALRASGEIFQVDLLVTKISVSGQTAFMGVFSRVHDDPLAAVHDMFGGGQPSPPGFPSSPRERGGGGRGSGGGMKPCGAVVEAVVREGETEPADRLQARAAWPQAEPDEELIARARRAGCAAFAGLPAKPAPPAPAAAGGGGCPFASGVARAAPPPRASGGGGCVFARMLGVEASAGGAGHAPAAPQREERAPPPRPPRPRRPQAPPDPAEVVQALIAYREQLRAVQSGAPRAGASFRELEATADPADSLEPRPLGEWEGFFRGFDGLSPAPEGGAAPAAAETEEEEVDSSSGEEGAAERRRGAPPRGPQAVAEAFGDDDAVARLSQAPAEAPDPSSPDGRLFGGKVKWTSETEKKPAQGRGHGQHRHGDSAKHSTARHAGVDVSPHDLGGRGGGAAAGHGHGNDEAHHDGDTDLDGIHDAKAFKMRTDFERARRCRKLQRLLNSLQLRRSIELLRKLTRYLLFAVLAAYVGGFIALQIQHQDFLQEIIRIKAVGQLKEVAIAAAVDVQLLMSAGPGPLTDDASSPVDRTRAHLQTLADDMDRLILGIYMGFGTHAFQTGALGSYIDGSSVLVSDWVNESVAPDVMSLPPIRAVREYIARARAAADAASGNFSSRLIPDIVPHQRFVVDNVDSAILPTLQVLQDMETADQLDRLQSGRDVALWVVIGMVIVLVLVFLAFRHLMGIVATARTGLFSVFLLIPIPVTVQLAERTVQTGALSQEDEDAFNLSIAGAEHMLADYEDQRDQALLTDGSLKMVWRNFRASVDSWLNRDRAAAKVAWTLTHRIKGISRTLSATTTGMRIRRSISQSRMEAVKIDTKDRKLDPKGAAAETYVFMLPLVFCGALSISAFAVTYAELGGAREHMVNIDAANREAAHASRVRMFAQAAVVAASSAGAGADARVKRAQGLLKGAANDLLLQHAALVRGSSGPGIPGTKTDSSEFLQLMFGSGCLRANQSTCFAESAPEFPRTNFGLDPLVRFFAEEAMLLADAPRADLAPTNELYRFIMEVGGSDIRDGLLSLAKIYAGAANDAPSIGQKILQVLVLPLMVVFGFVFLRRTFIPWIRRTLHESRVVAELLAQLPKELQVESMILESMGLQGETNENKWTFSNAVALVASRASGRRKVAPAARHTPPPPRKDQSRGRSIVSSGSSAEWARRRKSRMQVAPSGMGGYVGASSSLIGIGGEEG